jgi:hypothetical protein
MLLIPSRLQLWTASVVSEHKIHIPKDLSASSKQVSNLSWNPPRQHAAAVRELPGNELVITQTIGVACYQVGSELRRTLHIIV